MHMSLRMFFLLHPKGTVICSKLHRPTIIIFCYRIWIWYLTLQSLEWSSICQCSREKCLGRVITWRIFVRGIYLFSTYQYGSLITLFSYLANCFVNIVKRFNCVHTKFISSWYELWRVYMWLLVDLKHNHNLAEDSYTFIFVPTEIFSFCWIYVCGMQWALMTLLDPALSVENLIYIGYAGDPSSAVRVTRRRRVDRKKQHSDRNVFQCFVFGPKEAGKSSLLNSFVGRYFTEIYILEVGGWKVVLLVIDWYRLGWPGTRYPQFHLFF